MSKYQIFVLRTISILVKAKICYQYNYTMPRDPANKLKFNDQKHRFMAAPLEIFISRYYHASARSLCSSLIKEVLVFLLIIQAYFGLILLTNSSIAEILCKLSQSSHEFNWLYRTSQMFLLLLNIILLAIGICFGACHRHSLMDQIVLTLLKYFQIFVYVDLVLASFLSYINFGQNVTTLLLAALFALFQTITAQNYQSKKQEGYQTDIQLALSRILIIIASAMINALIVNYGSIQHYCYWNILASAVLFFWHLKGGSRLFLYRRLTLMLLFMGSVGISMGVICFANFSVADYLSMVGYFQLMLAITVLFTFLYFDEKQQTLEIQNVEIYTKFSNIKDYELQLYSILQQSEANLNKECLIIGVLKQHSERQCLNPQCWINYNQVYDPLMKDYLNTAQLLKQKDRLLKFYFKCMYENALKTNKTTKLTLDYCEFMLSEFCNASTHCLLLEELLAQNNMGLLQRIMAIKLKILLKERYITYNKLIFGGRVQLLEVLQSEAIFEKIAQKTRQYCSSHQSIWQSLMRIQIDLQDLMSLVKKNMCIVPAIDQEWRKLSNFFYVQKQWKYIYLHYVMYLKNSKMKSSELLFEHQINHKSMEQYSHNQQHFFTKQHLFSSKADDKLFFDKNSALFLTELRGMQLYLTSVSKKFECLLHYTQQQIKDSALNLIIPAKLRQAHRQGFTKWFQTGKSSNENGYRIILTHVINKEGLQIAVSLLFKIYISINPSSRLINFACLINSSKVYQQTSLPVKKYNFLEKITFFPEREAYNQKDLLLHEQKELKLGHQGNIFLKDEQFQPCQQNQQIASVKIITRTASWFFIALKIVSTYFVINQLSFVSQTADQTLFFLNAYRSPFGLMSNYLRSSLNLGNQTKLRNQINTFSTLLLNIATNSTMIKILSDQELNVPGKYAPAFETTANKGIIYDQIDIFYVVYSCTISISKNATINRTSAAFMQMDSYLKPAYHTMINGTKMKLYSRLSNLIDKLSLIYLVLIVVTALTYATTVCFFYFKVRKYKTKMKQFIELIVNLDEVQIVKIQEYWIIVKHHFGKLFLQFLPKISDNTIAHSTKHFKKLQVLYLQQQQMPKEEEFHQNATLNRKQKTLKKQAKQKCRLFSFSLKAAVLCMPLVCMVAVLIVGMMELSEVKIHLINGFTVMWHFPNLQLVSYGLVDQYYSLTYPNQSIYYAQRFQDTLANFNIMTERDYIPASDNTSLFLQKKKNYLFGNPCASNPAIPNAAGYTVKECEDFGNHTFKNGITAFLIYLKPLINNFLSSTPDMLNYDKAYLLDFANSLSLGAAFFNDLLQTWLTELQSMLNNLQTISVLAALAVCVLLLLAHCFIFEKFFIAKLEKDFALMKNVYMNFIPESIVAEQKLIKQKLLQTGLLQTN